jgi:predicted glycosyltransferase involved in capsule biosynthesis
MIQKKFQQRFDMKLDFLMPCRIESEDRLKNIITTVSFLLQNFPESNVIVKEVDSHSNFKFRAIPEIRKYADTTNLIHIYEESDEKAFHKTRILNDLLIESKSEIVFNHDVDMILPIQSYHLAYAALMEDQCDAIYPFGCGIYQLAVDYPMNVYEEFLNSKFNYDILNSNSRNASSTIGWGQMIKRQVEINIGMWNENFISWGAEDCEFYYRLNLFNYRVGRVNDVVYHLEHGRTFNSHYNNPKFMDNYNLWQWFRTQDRETVVKYYEQQQYLISRGEKLNVGV